MQISKQDEQKQRREKKAFQYFLERRGLPDSFDLIESQATPAPDILYKSSSGYIEYELCEICATNVAKTMAITMKSGSGVSAPFCPHDTYKEKLREKLFKKTYVAKYPMELLCYNVGRSVAWDDLIRETLEPTIQGDIKFSKIWLMGDEVHLLYDKKG